MYIYKYYIGYWLCVLNYIYISYLNGLFSAFCHMIEGELILDLCGCFVCYLLWSYWQHIYLNSMINIIEIQCERRPKVLRCRLPSSDWKVMRSILHHSLGRDFAKHAKVFNHVYCKMFKYTTMAISKEHVRLHNIWYMILVFL